MITVEDADSLIHEQLLNLAPVTVALKDAGERILISPFVADRDYPPFDRVAMDGYAIRYEAWRKGQRLFAVQGLQTAGQAPLTLSQPESAIEIMTGAKLAIGADLIVRYEDTTREGPLVRIHSDLEPKPWGNIHRQGEDAKKGQTFILTKMLPPEGAIAASFGLAKIDVARKARITMLGTGDELVSIEETPKDYQIRESNIHAVSMALRLRGHDVRTLVSKDDKEKIKASIAEALETQDVLILSGGVSAGKTDFIPEILEELGVKKVFHRIMQKPGKPLWFGRTSHGKVVFGLPGNPMSTLICLYRYVLPFLEASESNGSERSRKEIFVEFEGELPKLGKLSHFVPVRLQYGRDAKIRATALSHNGSGDFLGLGGTDGFIEIPGPLERDFNESQQIFKFWSWDKC